MSLDSKVPSGPLELKWQKHKDNIKPINPANKRKYKVLVVGTGLAGLDWFNYHSELTSDFRVSR